MLQDKGPTFGVRHVQILYSFLLTAIAYAMRVNLSVAIVAMTTKYSSNPDVPTYDWDNKSIILSSFFWAYIVLQISAGYLGRKYGTKNIMLGVVLVDSTAFILIPLIADKVGSYGVMVCRFIEGLAQGFVFPSIHTVLGHWAPPSERSIMGTITYCGATVGIIVTTPISGFICSSWAGWPATFYLFAALGYTWVFSFFFLGADSPASHKRISEKEKNYIESSLATSEQSQKMNIPWKAISLSLPAWSVTVAHIGSSWSLALLLTEIPTYFDKILKFNINANGLLSSAPYLAELIGSMIFGFTANYVINNCTVSVGFLRKLATMIGFVGPSFCILIMAYVSEDSTASVALLILGQGIGAARVAGFLLNHIDLSPNFCGILMGIANSLGSITSIVAPLTVQYIVTDETNIQQWRTVYIIAAVVGLGSALFFVFFASGDVQSWNSCEEVEPESRKHDNVENARNGSIETKN